MILRAAWVAPVSSPPMPDAVVQFRDGRIVHVGPWSPHVADSDDLLDLGDRLLTPGLVNPHTHLELGVYSGLLPPQPFWPWIAQLARIRSKRGNLAKEEASAGEWGRRSLACGVTCVGDISRSNVAWRTLREVPIRKVCFAELLSVADNPPRTPDELVQSFRGMIEDDRLTSGVTPHAPYTVPVEHARAAVDLAVSARRPWTTHLAETPEELRYLSGDADALPPMFAELLSSRGVPPPRLSAREWLAACGADRAPAALAHCNYLEEADFEDLARAGHTVVYCPRAHAFFQHEPHPFARMRAAGVRVAVGTDSPASNADVNMLAEMRHVLTTSHAPTISEAFAMGTLDAAHAIGLGTELGSIEPGKRADLCAWPIGRRESDPIRALLASLPDPVRVWVGGEQVWPRRDLPPGDRRT